MAARTCGVPAVGFDLAQRTDNAAPGGVAQHSPAVLVEDVGEQRAEAFGVGVLGGVPQHRQDRGQALRFVPGGGDRFGGGRLRAFGSKYGLEDFAGGARVPVVDGAVEPGVFVDREDAVGDRVEGGLLPGAAGGDVERFAGHVVGHQGMRGVDGGALRAVHGRRVRELDLGGDVRGREGDGAAVLVVFDLERTVLQAGGDGPGVAVADPVLASVDGEFPVVVAGDDPVPDPGAVAVVQLDADGLDLPGDDAVGAGAGGQVADAGGGGGEHEAAQPGGHVAMPGGVRLLQQRLGRAPDDPIVRGVEVQRGAIALAQLPGRGGLLRGGEAVQFGEFDGADLGGQQPQRAAGLDRGELPVVAEQPHGGAVAFGERAEGVEVAGAGQAGFVDQDHVAGSDVEERGGPGAVGGVGLVVGEVLVDELVEVFRRRAVQVAGQHRSRVGGGREGDQAAPLRGQDMLVGAHRGGLARTGWAETDREQGRVGGERDDHRLLPVVQPSAGAGLELCQLRPY